jgi:hypothetical protein
MQNKHEIPIPENHTAKIETIDGKVVVTFEPIIDFGRIKTGSKVMINITGQHCCGGANIDFTKPIDVVFFKSPYFIDSDGYFWRRGENPEYCTFNQDGNFVLFRSNINTDYITSVVEY